MDNLVWDKRMELRVATALARAAGAYVAMTSLSQITSSDQTGLALVTVGVTTKPVGRFVLVVANISATTKNASQECTFSLSRRVNATTTPLGAPIVILSSATADSGVYPVTATLTWLDTGPFDPTNLASWAMTAALTDTSKEIDLAKGYGALSIVQLP